MIHNDVKARKFEGLYGLIINFLNLAPDRKYLNRIVIFLFYNNLIIVRRQAIWRVLNIFNEPASTLNSGGEFQLLTNLCANKCSRWINDCILIHSYGPLMVNVYVNH